MATTQEQLDEVNAAISQALKAQEMGIGSRRHRMPDIDKLFKERDRLEQKLGIELGQNITVAQFDTR
jgi:hypothetical protein